MKQCINLIIKIFFKVENWLKSVEAGLKSKECGDSVLGVEALLAKHKNVESSIRSQLAPGAAFDALEQRAKEMIKQGHSKSSLIQVILEDVHAGKRDLEQLANARRQLLEHSLMYQNFLLNYYDCVQWIKGTSRSKIQFQIDYQNLISNLIKTEKTATAMDKNYADLTNLQTKIQRHATFTSDLKKSGQKRVDDIHSEADALRPRSDLDEMLSDLDSQWLALKQATDIKRKRLDDAYKCVHFTRQCDDLSAWFDEAELELGSDDQGRDLASCKLLLLRHETLVKQIDSQREKLADLEGQLAASKENFMFGKMQEAFNAVKQRYLNLTEPCSIRHDNLDESLRLFEVCHELDDLTQWTQERLSHVGSVEQIHVTSLDETKKLLNKHEQLCAELKQQQPVYVSLQKTTKQLIDRKHFSHALLATKLSDLEQKWTRLADLVDQKSVRLEQVLEMQVYFAEVDEFNEWLKEKQVDLLSPDYGNNRIH
jgi:spectrin beta